MPKPNWTVVLLTLLCLYVNTNNVFAQEDPFLEYGIVYSSLPWYNLRGGLDKGFVYMDNADVTAKLNFNELFHWEQDFSIFLYGLGNHGGRATDLMGDFQVASNIQAPKAWRLFEAWAQQNFFEDKVSVLVGLYDLNSEFDVLRPGTIFVNSSFGIGAEYAQSGLNGPSIFPISSVGTRLSIALNDQIKLKVAVLDGVPGNVNHPKSNRIKISADEGALIAFESSFYTSTAGKYKMQRGYVTRRKKVGREHSIPTNDKVNLGGWYYTSPFEFQDGSGRSGQNFGVYLGGQKYWFYSSYDDRYIAFFARYGISAQHYNQLSSALSAGLVLAGSTSEATDYFGVAISSGFNGDCYLSVNPERLKRETAIEVTYSFPFRKWLTLQPDLQYVINPSTAPEINNPLAVGLLIQVSVGRGI
ncbi:carbohydrate porin [Marinoscillum pacificum]|uniref:carbohydrate porin n=1 Tax=Marinoscillum pacificum TaxID=392723 RepID=UPI002157D330|nr:carbohydrate porin [Marinoscillum pacificum]